MMPGYSGVDVRLETFTQLPPWRICTVKLLNQPPSKKFMPS